MQHWNFRFSSTLKYSDIFYWYKMSDIIFKKMWTLQKGLQFGSFFLTLEYYHLFSTCGSLNKYPKISEYLDRISKIWIMKKNDIQNIQLSMYPKKTDIHVSKYPCIHASMISKYPLIQLSKKNQYPRYPSIRISEKSGIRPSLWKPCILNIFCKK